jgi:F-type H+-transporting ATPase subunit b
VMSFALLLLAENILAIDGSFLFAFISILLLIFILNATLFRPINKVLEDREKMSGGTSHEAKDLIKEYDRKVMQYEDGIRNARYEAYQSAEANRREVLADHQDLIAQAKAEAMAQIEAAKQEIAGQTAAARVGLEKEAMAMAAKVSTSILHRPVNAPEGI